MWVSHSHMNLLAYVCLLSLWWGARQKLHLDLSEDLLSSPVNKGSRRGAPNHRIPSSLSSCIIKRGACILIVKLQLLTCVPGLWCWIIRIASLHQHPFVWHGSPQDCRLQRAWQLEVVGQVDLSFGHMHHPYLVACSRCIVCPWPCSPPSLGFWCVHFMLERLLCHWGIGEKEMFHGPCRPCFLSWLCLVSGGYCNKIMT